MSRKNYGQTERKDQQNLDHIVRHFQTANLKFTVIAVVSSYDLLNQGASVSLPPSLMYLLFGGVSGGVVLQMHLLTI